MYKVAKSESRFHRDCPYDSIVVGGATYTPDTGLSAP